MNSSQQPPQNIKSMDFHALCVDCCELPWTKNLWKSMESPWTCGLFTPKSMEFGHYCGLCVDFVWTFHGLSVDKIYKFAVGLTQNQKVRGKSTESPQKSMGTQKSMESMGSIWNRWGSVKTSICWMLSKCNFKVISNVTGYFQYTIKRVQRTQSGT